MIKTVDQVGAGQTALHLHKTTAWALDLLTN